MCRGFRYWNITVHHLLQWTDGYRIYQVWFWGLFKSGHSEYYWRLQELQKMVKVPNWHKRYVCKNNEILKVDKNIIIFRFWMGKQAEICEDLFWHPHIWQNHQGQGSKVCGHVVSNRWHHGSAHRIFHHQWSGDYLFCS